MTDLYKLLGVSTTASVDEIKQAYRKLARTHHPDVNPDPKSQERFKEINQAYEILGDEQKRSEYDQNRSFPGGQRGQFHQTHHTGNFNDIFEQMFSNMGFGGFEPRQAKNPDSVFQLNISLEDAYKGKQVQVNFTDSAQTPINIQVTIPAGVEDGMRLKYAGNGARTHTNLPPGDLIIVIHVEPHATWQRQGPHLHQEIQVPLWKALVGDTLMVSCIDGGQVQVKMPELSLNQTVLKVAQKGMKVRNSPQRGDLYLHVKVTIPTNLTEEQRAQITTWCI
jgi:DnaJ-class molecular chaperone